MGCPLFRPFVYWPHILVNCQFFLDPSSSQKDLHPSWHHRSDSIVEITKRLPHSRPSGCQAMIFHRPEKNRYWQIPCCMGMLHHLRLNQAPSRSTIPYTNALIPRQMFRDLFHETQGNLKHPAPGEHRFRFKHRRLTLNITIISPRLYPFL